MKITEIDSIELQELLDGGFALSEIQRRLNLPHHMYIIRAIDYYELEKYVAFDEFEYRYSSRKLDFNWIVEEDKLESIVNEIYHNGKLDLLDNDLDLKGISKYVRINYDNIVEYFKIKDYEFLLDDLYMSCLSCGISKTIKSFYEEKGDDKYGYFGVKGTCKDCIKNLGKSWNKRNYARYRELMIQRFAKRRALDLHLGYDFSVKENEKIFGTTCVLTGDTDIAYDHFVPLNWGHVGSYNRNMYPLNQRLNSSKWAHNPFDWFEDNYERFGLISRKFDDLVTTLAELNGLTTDEYRDFVYWCEANKREPEEIALDPRPSIDIWRDSMKVGDVT